jgi:hypothetical protein
MYLNTVADGALIVEDAFSDFGVSGRDGNVGLLDLLLLLSRHLRIKL